MSLNLTTETVLGITRTTLCQASATASELAKAYKSPLCTVNSGRTFKPTGHFSLHWELVQAFSSQNIRGGLLVFARL